MLHPLRHQWAADLHRQHVRVLDLKLVIVQLLRRFTLNSIVEPVTVEQGEELKAEDRGGTCRDHHGVSTAAARLLSRAIVKRQGRGFMLRLPCSDHSDWFSRVWVVYRHVFEVTEALVFF